MATVADLVSRVQTILNELTILQHKISESYDNYVKPSNKGEITLIQEDYVSKGAMYDRLFQEKEGASQSSRKGRAQTLQEYVLLFFFVAFAIFSISLALLSSSLTGKGMQVFGLMSLIIILSGALIMRYG